MLAWGAAVAEILLAGGAAAKSHREDAAGRGAVEERHREDTAGRDAVAKILLTGAPM